MLNGLQKICLGWDNVEKGTDFQSSGPAGKISAKHRRVRSIRETPSFTNFFFFFNNLELQSNLAFLRYAFSPND